MERRYTIKNLRVNNILREHNNNSTIYKSTLIFVININDEKEIMKIKRYCTKTNILPDRKSSVYFFKDNQFPIILYANKTPRYLKIQMVSWRIEIIKDIADKIISDKKECLLNIRSEIPWIKALSDFSLEFMLT